MVSSSGDFSTLRDRLASLTPEDQHRLLVDLVTRLAAGALRRPESDPVDATGTFFESGFDSLTAVELHSRLIAATGLALPVTLVFDYPTPAALARHLQAELLGLAPESVVAALPPPRYDEPIAIVGMACRFPGGVTSPEDLWQLVLSGVDAIGEFPANRGWDLDALYHPDPDRSGTSYTRHGGFLYDADRFDADFFGINPREALAMDAQQRLVLETAWEAFERAGIDPTGLRGQRVGVFVGAETQEYGPRIQDATDGIEGYLVTGNAASVASGRVSYTLGFQGPALTVDTACSSSLVALHLAVQALRQGECTMALAGGIAVMASPASFIAFSRQRGLAADGRSKPFAASADGTSWSEGVGMLLVERLSDAQRQNHDILAVVRGSAVNQDGASNGLTAPNGPSQQRVIRQALAVAGLTPADVDVVEAHGTGTTLGDPIEAQAVLATYGRERRADDPLWLGSLKSNIGHTQAAAGVGGVIKMVMAMRHGVLPATLHIDEPTPHVDWSAGAVQLLTEAVEWPARERPRRAAVSSFGMSGTNAHLLLEAFPSSQAPAAPADTAPADTAPADTALPMVPLVLSGASADALRGQAANLVDRLPGASPVDLGLSLATTRARFAHRAVVLGARAEELRAGLSALADGIPSSSVLVGTAGSGRLAVLFTGQGAQRIAMGRQLYAAFPAFAAAFDEACWHLDLQLDRPLRAVIDDEPELLGRTGYAQPALFAVEVAVLALLRHWGVTPEVVAGHSVGEVAAAYAAGVLDLSDAAALVGARGRLMETLPTGGSMLAVQAPSREVAALLGAELDLAAINGPTSVVVSGPSSAIESFVDLVAARGWQSTRLRTSHAFHSRLMEPMLAEFRRVLRFLSFREPKLPVVSTVTGRPVGAGEWTNPEYWARQVREPVRFADAVDSLAGMGVARFVEAGPDGVLTAMAQQCLPDAEAVFVPVLRRDRDEAFTALTALASLFVHGAGVDWANVFAGTGARRVDLPTYAFQRQSFWLSSSPLPQPSVEGDALEARFWESVERADLPGLASQLGIASGSLAEVVPALASWRARRRLTSTAEAWRYRVTWKPIAEPASAMLSGTWLLIGDDPSLSTVLLAAGASVRPVPAGPDRSSLAALLPDVDTAVDGVLAPVTSAAGALAVVQALADAGIGAPLWLVTRNGVSTGRADRPVDIELAQVWGLGRVVGLEHPDRWGGLLDLPETIDRRAAARIVATLAGLPGNEDQVAVRGSGIVVRRLVHAPVSGADTRAWRPSGTVLITGGTGALGAEVARWVAAGGADRVVLVSRRGPDAPGAADLAASLSIEVDVRACDMADRTAVAELLAAVGEINAVVHAAGVAQDAPLVEADEGHLTGVLAGKVAGALHLDELLAGVPLEAFVVFSSISGVWGSGGQAAYAAANAALDALIQRRRANGQVGTAVAWGPWARVGMAADPDEAARLGRQGLLAMEPDHAIAALAQAVGAGEDLLTIADVRWEVFLPVFAAARPRPLLAELAQAQADLSAEGATVVSSFVQRLADLPADERARLVKDVVRTHVAAALGHASTEAVAPGRAFKELGFDSLTAVELRNRLTAATGLQLPATLVFDYPSVERLSDFVLSRIFGSVAAVSAPTTVAISDDPVVIVGMGCRFPGGVETPDRLWELVLGGEDAIGAFPADRGWDLDALYHPDPDHAGTSYVREGGFVYDAGDFDAALFGISPREAVAMDPQQRLLLEISWEAFERAGIDPLSLRGRSVGVFTGSNGQDYAADRSSIPSDVEGYLGTGTAGSVLSGRLAYTFGLEGPAVTVDTACSSSLVALHLAVQALRGGECEMALVGGVTIMATPDAFIDFSRQRGLAADGRCKSFAAGADGTAWAEGAGVVLVERLSDARRQGHHILAVVRGTAVNQDGASNGLTAPNGPSQQRVIRQALAVSGLSAADVDAIEAHGTGTALGDPIEAEALLATYGQDRPSDRPLLLGSVKSNIGHTQAAAGVAGIIKMVLAMRHGTLPATLHVDAPSPHVDWSSGAISLVTSARPWTSGPDRPRRAGVSAFGVSGTNAHVILEQGPVSLVPSEASSDTVVPVVPVVLSGHDEAALRAQAVRVNGVAGVDVLDLGAALVRRAPLAHRAVALVSGHDELHRALDGLAAGGQAVNLVRGTAAGGRLAVLFTGQGAQRLGMGRELYELFPVFADAFDAVCAHLDVHLDRPLRAVIDGEPELLAGTGFAQPALFAVEVALLALLEHWGVRPDVVVGHSVGEVAAAYAAGVLDLADAATLVAARGRLMQALPVGGAMLAVQASEAEVADLLGAELDVAAVNGPSAVVVSGSEVEVAAFAEVVAARGWKSGRLRTSHAFHSRLMEPMLGEFAAVVGGLSFREPSVAVVSTVTGRLVGVGEWSDPGYWVEQVRRPVRFADAVASLAVDGVSRFVEVGPDGVLTAMAQLCLPEAVGAVFVPVLRRDRDEPVTVLTALASLFVHGVDVDWAGVFAGAGARPVELPTYAFQRQRYWISGAAEVGNLSAAGVGAADHPLLGAVIKMADGDGAVLTGKISLRTHPWLADHVVAGVVLLPGTAFVDLAVLAGDHVDLGTVEELTLHLPLAIGERETVQLQVTAGRSDDDGRRSVLIHSRVADEPGAQWRHHASAVLAPTGDTAQLSDEVWPPSGASPVEVDGVYEHLRDVGLDYGPTFRGLRAAWRRGEDLFVEVELRDEEQRGADRFGVHPALFDAALHALTLTAGPSGAASPNEDNAASSNGDGAGSGHRGAARLPFAWNRVTIHARGEARLRVRLSPTGTDAIRLSAVTDDGRPVLTVGSLVLRPLPAGRLDVSARHQRVFGLEWDRVAVPASGTTAAWAVLTDPATRGDLAARLGVDIAQLIGMPAFADVASLAAASTAPTVVLLPCLDGGEDQGGCRDLAEAVRAATIRVAERVREWLAAPRTAASRLVVITRGAVLTEPGGDLEDLTHAAGVWGLLRSAQQENPDRLQLVDVDGDRASWRTLAGVVAGGEPQVAIRRGTALAPRLARARIENPVEAEIFGGPEDTVLITGGTGTLGRHVARHLVHRHGIRNLLLVSRRGADAIGAGELVADLERSGARVTIAAADIADRDQLAHLLARIPAEHPLTAVIHTAGTLQDGIIESMTPDRIAPVLRPKVDGAVHLHELTQHMSLKAFVLFSSASAIFGTPGQANYAAANAFLEALAQHRRAIGLPAQALAWGPWAEGGMAGALGEVDLQRMARSGVLPLTAEEGLELFDAGLAAGAVPALPMHLDLKALRAVHGEVPLLLRRLVPSPARTATRAAATGGPTIAQRLAAAPAAERPALLLQLVQAQVAVVLGHATDQDIDPTRGFLDLGFDSLTAVELRNGLTATTGLRLPSTLIFDYPTSEVLADHLHQQLQPPAPVFEGPAGVLTDLDRLEAALATDGLADAVLDQVTGRLQALLQRSRSIQNSSTPPSSPQNSEVAERIDAASDDDLFAFIDNELGM